MSRPFDFDAPPAHDLGDSMKWGRYAGRDVIPLWVADMDFAAPPAVTAALRARVAGGLFGYHQVTPAQTAAVIDHLARDFGWTVAPEWLVWLPGLVSGLNIACRAVGGDSDAVFTATPIYPPFLSAPQHAGRRVASVPLQPDTDGRWQWDFAAVEAALAASRARLFLLCHPHNPVGRVWREDELARIEALATRHEMVVCSDEIHNGLLLEPGLRHQPYAARSAAAAAHSITLMAPSKTFNIPGLGAAFAVIPDPALRRAFRQAMAGIVPHVNILGMTALEAAYARSADWHAALLDYLRDNAARVRQAINAIPGLACGPIEATYLAWIDAREYQQRHGLANAAKHFETLGVGLSDGADFGAPGFVRLNFGTRRALLDAALARLAA